MSTPQVLGRKAGAAALIACFTANVFFGAFINTYGVFLSNISGEFSIAMSQAVVAPMVFLVLYSLGAPMIGRMLDRYPARTVMSSAVLVMAAGFLMLSMVSGFIPFLVVVALTIALPAQASGMAAASKVIARWFSSNRGLALGVAALGVSVGGAVFPSLGAFTLEIADWRTAYRLIAALLALVLAPLLFWAIPRRVPAAAAVNGRSPEARLSFRRILSRPRFWLVVALTAPTIAVMGALSIHLVSIGIADGLTGVQAATVLSVVSGVSALSKVAWGWALDRFGLRLLLWFAFGLQFAGVIGFLLSSQFVPMLLAASIFGLGVGAEVPAHSILVGRLFGWADFGAIYGATYPVTLPLTLATIFGAAKSVEATGGYTVALLGFAAILGVAVVANIFAAYQTKDAEQVAVGSAS